MALKIIKAEQPIEVKNLTICLYAQPGIGKTSTAFTADKPLLFDFDKGAHRSNNRKDSVEIDSWSDVINITEDDLKPYNTIIVDAVGRALDVLTVHLMKTDPKLKNRNGSFTLQGYGVLKNVFTDWLKLMRSFGKDVVLVAHMSEEKNGDDTVERLDIQGGSKNEIYKVADVMGRLKFSGNDKRVIDFNPSASGFGKNPTQLPVKEVPSFKDSPTFLGDLIDEIKNKLNESLIAYNAKQEKLSQLEADLMTIDGIDAFNEQLMIMADSSPIEKQLLLKVGKKKGFSFNKELKVFEVVA
ncbi:ATP-binding protein [Gilliamella sp. BG2]|uniref:ATP-binding protein n=1 Tax=Gilliamella sp. BG2 TaxID=3351509 RepID=UPI003986CD7B